MKIRTTSKRALGAFVLMAEVLVVGCNAIIGLDTAYTEVSCVGAGCPDGSAPDAPDAPDVDAPTCVADDGCCGAGDAGSACAPWATSISMGTYHACAITAAGGAKCWGSDNSGELGNIPSKDSLVPVDVHGLTAGMKSISVGHLFTCALTSAGGVLCWGYDGRGDLGNGAASDSIAPVGVTGLSAGVTAVAAGVDGDHSCAATGGGVMCWGDDNNGCLGNDTDGVAPSYFDVPVSASGLMAVAVSAGQNHSCALASVGGGVWCWGWNGFGQIGNGSTASALVPTGVAGFATGGLAVAAGDAHTCAIATGGVVSCWGDNTSGDLGNGSPDPSSTPVAVANLGLGVTAIATGASHTCAITGGGGVMCWGSNSSGQLGNGGTSDASFPVGVVGLSSGVTAITAGGDSTCALTGAGKALCWGDNSFGQLGNGTDDDSNVPVAVVED